MTTPTLVLSALGNPADLVTGLDAEVASAGATSSGQGGPVLGPLAQDGVC
jgi:hypothetical protein